jgi:hypothetical protein
MMRSYALAFAAVTLRLYLPIFQITHVDFMIAYRITAWLCWVPNLAFAELVLVRAGWLRAIPPRAAPSQSPG